MWFEESLHCVITELDSQPKAMIDESLFYTSHDLLVIWVHYASQHIPYLVAVIRVNQGSATASLQENSRSFKDLARVAEKSSGTNQT